MRKFFFISALIALIAIMLVPMAVYAAPSYPALNGKTYYQSGSFDYYNLDNTKISAYRGMAIAFTSQTNEKVVGTLTAYQAANIRGTYLVNGTARYYMESGLKEGNNTVVVLTNGGTLSLTLPTGVTAIATSGTAAVTGSPASLAAGGVRTITTSTSGLFTLAISRTSTIIGSFQGSVGQNTVSKGRFIFEGSQPYGTVTDKTGTATGSPVVCLDGDTTIVVSGAGTFDVAVPYGMVGTCTSGTATIAGSPVTLPGGATTTVDTGATNGNMVISLQRTSAFTITGFMKVDGTGLCTNLKGDFRGYIVTDTVNKYRYPMLETVNLAYQAP